MGLTDATTIVRKIGGFPRGRLVFEMKGCSRERFYLRSIVLQCRSLIGKDFYMTVLRDKYCLLLRGRMS